MVREKSRKNTSRNGNTPQNTDKSWLESSIAVPTQTKVDEKERAVKELALYVDQRIEAGLHLMGARRSDPKVSKKRPPQNRLPLAAQSGWTSCPLRWHICTIQILSMSSLTVCVEINRQKCPEKYCVGSSPLWLAHPITTSVCSVYKSITLDTQIPKFPPPPPHEPPSTQPLVPINKHIRKDSKGTLL